MAALSGSVCECEQGVREGEESSGALDRPAGPWEEEGKERKGARREAKFFFVLQWGDFLVDG